MARGVRWVGAVRTCAKTWVAVLVATVTACAIPVAQARAASCKRAAALVSGAMAGEHPEGAQTIDVRDRTGAPLGIGVDTPPCPSVVVIVNAPSSITPALRGHLAAATRSDRAPPASFGSGLERPPRRA